MGRFAILFYWRTVVPLKVRKFLSVDDLSKFCTENDSTTFDSADSGYKIFIQSPAVFETDDEESNELILYGKIKLMHTGRNRNQSNLTKEAAENCLPKIQYKPLLANFCEIDGVEDFTSHDIEIDDDGNIKYIEHQIGCFTSDEPTLEYEEDSDRWYVYAKVAIPREYTSAADIIERKGGTKVSAELIVNKFSYDAKEKELLLEDIEVMGATCLGVNPETGEAVEEGMEGAKITVMESADPMPQISLENKLIESLDKLNVALANFNKENSQKGGSPTMFDSLLEKYGKTVEDVTFDYAELTDEELEAKFAEVFGEEAETGEPENFQKVFSISHEDTRVALYGLLEAQESADNDYYFICQVYDDHFIYQSWVSGQYYGQKYTSENDVVALSGNRYSVYAEFVTEEEKATLDEMRANYSSIKEKLEKYEAEPEKMQVLESSDYEYIADKEEFVAFKEMNAHFDMTVEDVKKEADSILLKYAKAQAFGAKPETKTTEEEVGRKNFVKPTKKQSRYGNLFSR